MKPTSPLFIAILTILILLPVMPLGAQPLSGEDGASPYFLVKSDDPGTVRRPWMSSEVRVAISGVIADVTVTQIYTNEGRRPIEAVYIFPAATRAAVYGLKMRLGERTIEAKIKPREAARRIYEQARQTGRSAALLEQQRPNVFQMNVANILPADVVTVELRYTELLVPVDGVYDFIYPTVVGPRYTKNPGETGRAAENWTANPYLKQGAAPTSTFAIAASLQAGLPIADLSCETHRVGIDFTSRKRVTVALDNSERHGGNRDFILKYRLAGNRIETGLLLFEGKRENFFLAMIQPPRHVARDRIPPREYVFIVDVSGSMHGFPLDTSKALLSDLIGGLRPMDRFNVLLFAGGSRAMSTRSVPATAANIRKAVDLIDHQRGGGGTELLPALRRALALPRAEGAARTVVIATDGYVTVEKEAFDLIRRRLGDATMMPFGIGSSVNRHLIEGLARAGMGEPFVVTDPAGAKNAANRFRKLIATPVVTRIEIDYGTLDAYDIEPPAIPDLLAERPVIVFGKYRGAPRGRIRVTGTSGSVPFEKQIDVAANRPSGNNRALRYLWARHRIAVLSDYNRFWEDGARTREITQLGLAYNLLTANTSFVALDTRRRIENGQYVTVNQPLPLPQGVSDLAVGKTNLGAPLMRKLKAPAPSSVPGEIREQTWKEEDAGSTAPKNDDKEGKAFGLTLEWVQALGLPETAVRTFLENNLDRIEGCAAGAVAEIPRRFSILFTIDPAGIIIAIETITPRNMHALADCLSRAMQGLRFPAPGGVVNHGIVATFSVGGAGPGGHSILDTP